MRKIRPRITPEEYELVKGIRDQCRENEISPRDLKHGWIKSKKSSLFFKNPLYQDVNGIDIEKAISDACAELRNYSPKWKPKKRKPGENLLLIDPADIHIGKLASAFETGETYNSQIAVQRVIDGVEGILSLSAPYAIDQIVLVIGNDVLHIDTPKRTTTSGTPQDTSEMWYESFLKANKLFIDVIKRLWELAPVHVVYNPSNHDYMSGFFLANGFLNYFHDTKGITFDITMSHRKYYVYHNNLIGTTHGDGAKKADLGLLMAHESKEWSKVKHRYFYTHHVHHKDVKDQLSVVVESLRSPSGTDGWHHRNGYQHAPKAIEGYIHHKEHGQTSRFTHLF